MLSNKLSTKFSEFTILAVVTLMYIALCAEADMYVPAFPQMVEYYSTTEDKIQLILSINFVGLCIASLICGPLSDAFGRRKVLLVGLVLFFISSLACIFTQDFAAMLYWRLIQGMSASVPMVVGCAVFLDKYSLEKASQLVGILNTVITAAMAAAPILGAWISTVFHWRVNFIVICVLATLSLLGTLLFIDESLPERNRKQFNLMAILKDYSIVIRNFKFIGYCVISLFPFVAIVVYIGSLSLILVNHLDVSLNALGYYQATTMGTFMLFSALSAKLIAKKGIEYTKNWGGSLAITGGTGLFIIAFTNPTSVTLICASMAILAAGGAFMVGPFGMKALEIFPEMKGTAAAMQTAIRQLLAAGLVLVSEILFNGTIVPIAMILFSYICIATLWYVLMQDTKSLAKATTS